MLTLTCAPGASGGGWFAQQFGQHRRRDAGQNEPAPDEVLFVAAAVTHLAVRVHGVNLCAGGYFGAMATAAAAARAAVTEPIPPMGTSQSPPST